MSSSHLSNSQSKRLPTSDVSLEVQSEAQVFNLTVLVRTGEKTPVVARAANLSLPEVEAQTIREALSLLVASAKKKIGERIANSHPVPWIEPPNEPVESESRYLVPLHL